MISNPLVSVLLPCYNAETTLDEALASLACQTMADFEVVAVDDGSSDATPAILERWSCLDARFRWLRSSHLGIVSTLNTGWQLCRSLLIARMDADDRCRPRRLELQTAYLQAHPEASLVASCVEAFPSNHVRLGLRTYLEWQNSILDDADIRCEIFVESPLTHPSVTVRREWLERVGGYHDHGWAEDYDLWLRLYLSGAGFAKLPQVLLEWREGPERLTRIDERYSQDNFLRLKAHYLAQGPCAGRDAVFLWGAGITGRRLCRHLLHQEVPLAAFVDIDPRKIGHSRHSLPVLPPEALSAWWQRYTSPVILAAVGARGARPLVRQHLVSLGFVEGRDWWCVA
jgi:glycosyltransferase involved in cell wall biosynthesis